MSFTSLLVDSVTVFNLIEGAGDRYGDPTETFGTGVVVQGRLEQTDQREFLNDRDTRVSEFRLFLPAATVISATSEVVIEGDRFRVNGDPAIVQDSSGPHHLEVPLEGRGRMTSSVVFVPNPFGITQIDDTLEMSRAMTEVATAVEAVAKVIAASEFVAPTGAYAASLHVEQATEDGKAVAHVVADVPYAVFVEFGTSDTPTFAPLRRASESVGVL